MVGERDREYRRRRSRSEPVLPHRFVTIGARDQDWKNNVANGKDSGWREWPTGLDHLQLMTDDPKIFSRLDDHQTKIGWK